MATKGGRKRSGLAIFGIILFLFFAAWVVSTFILGRWDTADLTGDNVARIPIDGLILTDAPDAFFGSEAASSSELAAFIRKADRNPTVKIILLEINSPGGSAVAAEEIAEAIRQAEKPTVAYIRDIGLSAGYWIASSADEVYASRLSLVGSIGVIGSYLEFSGLFDRYGVTYQRLVAGKYKDMGSPFKPLSGEEEALFQTQLDRLHVIFIETVSENRDLPYARIEELATGEFFIGDLAYEHGLIDGTLTPHQLEEHLEETLGTSLSYVDYKQSKGLLDLFTAQARSLAYWTGEGIGSSLFRSAQSSPVRILV